MVNQCNFIGNLGAEPEARFTQSGTAVTNFRIACSEKYTNKAGEKVETTEWVSIVTWDRLAEICAEWLHKGSKVYISGKLSTRKWQDKDGNDKFTTEIVAREMKMLGEKKSTMQDNTGNGFNPVGPTGDDVPF